MSIRESPFYGSGRFSQKAMGKLNLLARRTEMFGVNSTSPIMLTSNGSVTLYRKRAYSAATSSSEFDWSLFQFGWELSAVLGSVLIKAGSVFKSTYTPVLVPQATVAIGTSNTYVGLQVVRDMTNATIISNTSEPVSDSDWVKVWFFIFIKSSSGEVSLVSVGHLGNVDITAYGD